MEKNQKNPDADIEEFWLCFKQSMNNFYEKNKNLERPINYWSNVLNKFQKNQNYEKIEEHIQKYISLYAIDLLRTNSNYNIQILITNISRWNKLTCKYAFSVKEKTYSNFIFVLVDIYKTLVRNLHKTRYEEKVKQIFSQFDLMLLYQDYSPLVLFAIEYNKPNILDKLFEFDKQIYEDLLEEYKIDLPKNTTVKGDKLIKLIKSV